MSKKLWFDNGDFEFIPFDTKGFIGKRAKSIVNEARSMENNVAVNYGGDGNGINDELSESDWFRGAKDISMGRFPKRSKHDSFRSFPTILGSGEKRHYAARIKTIKGGHGDLELAQDTLHCVILKNPNGDDDRVYIKLQEVYYGEMDFIHAMTTGMPQSHSKASKSAYILFTILLRNETGVNSGVASEVTEQIWAGNSGAGNSDDVD